MRSKECEAILRRAESFASTGVVVELGHVRERVDAVTVRIASRIGESSTTIVIFVGWDGSTSFSVTHEADELSSLDQFGTLDRAKSLASWVALGVEGK